MDRVPTDRIVLCAHRGGDLESYGPQTCENRSIRVHLVQNSLSGLLPGHRHPQVTIEDHEVKSFTSSGLVPSEDTRQEVQMK